MFGLGKRNGVSQMKSLLVKTQGQLSHEGLGQEMRIYQHALVDNARTFKEYGESFASEGMSEAGGLAKFCFNAIEKTITPISEGLTPMPFMIDLAEKMAYVALTIDRVLPEDDLKDKDKIMIREASVMAHKWLTHEQRTDYLRKFEELYGKIAEDIKSDGLVKAVQNGSAHMQRLTAW